MEIVFANETLRIVTKGRFIPAVHRVDKADVPRLSIVYELRPTAQWHVEHVL